MTYPKSASIVAVKWRMNDQVLWGAQAKELAPLEAFIEKGNECAGDMYFAECFHGWSKQATSNGALG